MEAEMKGSRRESFRFASDSHGPWRNPLPPVLRVAAEVHVGAWVVFTILAAAKKGLVGTAAGIFLGMLAWGQTHFRGRTSPVIWWTNVVVFTIFGAFMCIVVVTI